MMPLSKPAIAAFRGERAAILEGWRKKMEAETDPLSAHLFARKGAASLAAASTLDHLGHHFKAAYEGGERVLSRERVASFGQDCALYWNEVTGLRGRITRPVLSLQDEVLNGLVRRGLENETLLAYQILFLEMGLFLEKRTVEGLQLEVDTLREEFAASHHIANRFLANSSHELRTPLTAVLGFSELLLEGNYGELTETQAPIVGHIENSAQNLLEIINNLLDVLHIRSGSLNLKREPVSIFSILTHICDILSPLSVRKQVTLVCSLQDTGMIFADENIVRHIFYSLLSSSLRATPSGGEVSIQNRKAGENIEIEVTDTAFYLPQEAIQQLKEPFPLLENAPVRGYEGWEVGLPLALRYVEMHEGEIVIESQPHQGTCFRITLPIRPPAAEALGAKTQDRHDAL